MPRNRLIAPKIPGAIGLDKNLRIRIGAKAMAKRNELLTEFNVVVDFTIKDEAE